MLRFIGLDFEDGYSVARPLEGPLAFSRHLGLACDASDAPMLALLGRLADGLKTPALSQSTAA